MNSKFSLSFFSLFSLFLALLNLYQLVNGLPVWVLKKRVQVLELEKTQVTQGGKGSSEKKKVQQILTSKYVMGILN